MHGEIISFFEWHPIALFTMIGISYTGSYYILVIKRDDQHMTIQLLSKNIDPLAIMVM